MTDYLVDCGVYETHKLDFRDGTHALGRHSNGNAGDHTFSERRILDAINAKALLQSCRCAKYSAVYAHVFAQNDHVGVVVKLPSHRHCQRID